MDHTYKCTGSVILWILNNRLHRAYMVWMMAQKYDRKCHHVATGSIHALSFLDWISISMDCKRKKQERYIGEALQYGFLEKLGHNFLIRSYRKMVGIGMDHQKRKYDEDKSGCTIPPELFLKADRKFSTDFRNFVDPKSERNTVYLLTEFATIQNSLNYRGKLNQSKILNCSRSTIQRRNRGIIAKRASRFIIIDVMRLLIAPKCSSLQAIKILKESEIIYRKSKKYLRGRQLLHQKTINGKRFLAIQLPDMYYSMSGIKETPAIRETVKWLHSPPGGLGYCTIPISHVSSSAEDDIVVRKSLSLGVEWPIRFRDSGDQGSADIPISTLTSYLQGLNDILYHKNCQSFILRETGSPGYKPFSELEPLVWSDVAHATPCLQLFSPEDDSREDVCLT